MHTPPLPQEGLSAVSSIKNWIVPGLPITQAALLPTNSVAEQKSATRIEMALDLLLIRMEALGLQPGEVKRIDTAVLGIWQRPVVPANRRTSANWTWPTSRPARSLRIGRSTVPTPQS